MPASPQPPGPARRRMRLARLRNGQLGALEKRLPRRRARLAGFRNPITARAGGTIFGGSLPGGRITRGVGGVVLLVLMGIGLRGIVGQKLNLAGQIERAARAKFIPQLEKQLGQKIEVGEFETDFLGRVVVHDVVVSRNSKLPTGALLRAKSLTIGLDIIGLALGRAKMPDAIQSVSIQSPQIYLERDPKGKFNLESLLPKTKSKETFRWSGQVTVVDGRVFYFDRALPSRSGRQLKVDLSGVNGTVVAAGEAPYRFDFAVTQTLLTGGTTVGKINANGAFALQPRRAWLDAKFPAIPVALVGDYAFPRGETVVSGGTVSGRANIALDGNSITPRGELSLQNISALSTQLREPLNGRVGSGAPLQVENLSGPLRFSNQAFETAGLTARALGTDWALRGAAAFEPDRAPLFDAEIATRAVPVARLQSWAKPGALPVDFASGALRLSARVSGDTKNTKISGALEAPAVRVNSKASAPTAFSAAMPRVNATFVAETAPDAPVKFSLRALAATAQGGARNAKWAGNGAATNLEITARGAMGPNSPLEIAARAGSWRALSDKYGESGGANLQINASTPALQNPNWRGAVLLPGVSTDGIKLSAISPDARKWVREIGAASVAVKFSDVGADFQKARADAEFTLSRIALSPDALPVSLRGTIPLDALTLRDLRGRVVLAGGKIDVPGARAGSDFGALGVAAAGRNFALELPDVRVSAAQINPFLRARGIAVGGDWRGRVALSGAQNGAIDARFEMKTARATARDLASSVPRLVLRDPTIIGRAKVAAGGAYRGVATVDVKEISARSGKLGREITLPTEIGGARVVSARATVNFSPNNWAARLDAVRAAVPVPGGVATVSEASVLASQGATRGTQISRMSASFAGGRFDGSAQLEGGKLSARVLARDVEASALQRLLAQNSLRAARVNGRIDAVIAVANGGNPSVDARLANGSVFVVKQNVIVPVDAARARLGIIGKTALVREATLWSDGARFSGAGTVDLGGRTVAGLPAANGTLQVDALRLANWASRLQALGVAGLDGQAWKQAELDGLVSGDFKLAGGANPRVDGTLEVRAATAFGADISSSKAQIAAAPQSARGWRVRVTDWKGRIEGAPFEGAIALDTVANTWSLKLQTENIDAGRAARLKFLAGPLQEGQTRRPLLPLEGNLSADIDVAGILKPDANDRQPFFVPRSGSAKLVAREVAWQGRPFGTLLANFTVEGKLARIETLQLVPATETAATPRLVASGTIPLSPDAPGLKLDLNVGEAPLQFFVDAARDAREILASNGVTQTALDSVVEYANALPPGTRGRVALEASVAGTLRKPIIEVPKFTLRDGRTPLPFGGFSPPATLDVGFSFDGNKATISQGEFRIQKTAADRDGAAPSDEEDDTLLRVEPGATVDPKGEIDLGADVFNANLSQLATWIPALRNNKNNPILRGDLSEFSLRLSGLTRAPDVIGSVQAENLRFNDYTLDRLRVARFEIRDGKFQVAPGNFTVAKGAYQSSAASGSISWNWARGGPQPDGPVDVNFPVETRDFAALAGLFVPALSQVEAQELSGGVQVGGTLAAPKLSGRVTLRDAKFSVSGPNIAVPVGLSKVNGTVRFTDQQRIEIDDDDPLRGKLTNAEIVAAPAVQKEGEKPKKKPKKGRAPEAPVKLAGDWQMRGNIGLDLSAQTLSNPLRAIGQQRYDLNFALSGGAIATPQLSGVREADAAAIFQTGDDGAQRLKWMVAARGRRKAGQSKGGGEMVSVGAMRLSPDFLGGTEALLRSRAETFTDAAAFADFAVAKRVNLAALPDRRPQISFNKMEWGYEGVGNGEVAGRLVLDNRGPIQQAPPEAVKLRDASTRKLRDQLKPKRALLATSDLGDVGFANARPVQLSEFDPEASGDEPLRLGGAVTLQKATIVGAPASGDGVVTRLSLLPDAPRFDVRLILGEDVQFVTSAFRTGLQGELVASGTPSDPQILGTVETRNGQVRFPNARARVTQGRVTIAINRDPATDLLRTRVDIDATASGRAGRYLITLGLSGPLDLSGQGRNLQDLRVDVTSNPPLSQNQAFAQLLGTAPGGDGNFSANEANQAYAGAVLQVLSAPLFSGVERSVAQALGLDSVSFEYRFDEPLAVQFSKALSDRVFVTYRRSFGNAQAANGTATSSRTPFELSIEYLLKGNLRLGLKTDQSRITTLTLGQTYRF